MKNNGAINEKFSHIRNYDYEVVCGVSDNKEIPARYEIPRENTGVLRDQQYEDCVANVIAQLAEAFWNNELGIDEKHSEGFIYGALRKDTSASPGMITSVAMELWNKIGTIPDKYFNTTEEMPRIMKIVQEHPELYDMAKKYRIEGYVQVSGDRAIKDALYGYKRGLVAVSHNGFIGGSHCIMLTGWDDDKNKYLFKNSWGEKYGDKGFSEINKNEINYVYMPMFKPIQLPFTDVKESDWFYKDVKNTFFCGMMQGTSDTTFEPERPVTRGEESAILNRQNKKIDERFDMMRDEINEKYEELLQLINERTGRA